MKEFVIIDGNSLINRAFYATPLLTNKDGLYTNAVYSFTNMLLKLIGEMQPSYIVVAFDMKAKTFRHNIYEKYKASRKGMPDELAQQMPLLKELLTAMDITILEKEGYEADDIIGTLSKGYDHQTVIITGDRDALQLVDETTRVYLTKRGLTDIEIVDQYSLKEKFGLSAKQVIEYKALCGDASDEIPGVRGIGDKTATSLIQKYSSIDNIYNNIDEIRGSLKDKLIAGKELAYLSKTLATIKTDCEDCGFDISKFSYTYPLTEKVRDVFIKLEFKNLLNKPHLFSNETVAVQHIDRPKNIVQIDSEEKLAEFIDTIDSDILSFYFDKNINISDSENEYVIKITDTFLPDAITFMQAVNMLKKLLDDTSVRKILFDAKSLMYRLSVYGVEIRGEIEDVCLMQYLIDSSVSAYDLGKVLYKHGYEIEFPAYALQKLYMKFKEQIQDNQQNNLYYNIEMPLMYILYEMEKVGFKIDIDTLEELSIRFKEELKQLTQNIYELAGEQFNINSSKQLAVILFDKLQLKSYKKTKSGLSTNVDVLDSLMGEHEIIPLIIRYRQIAKLSSTYIDGIKNMLDNNNVVHTVFKQALTTTGRLSSIEPNLQNIPVRDEDGREIRKMFIPSSSDNVLITADYSQIELRLLAHFSKDERLISAFKNNEDIHTITASEVFNVTPDEVTSEMRRSAKAVNFGIIYGISNFGLAKQLNIPPSRAKVYIHKYFETYGKVKDYMDSNIIFAKENGYSLTVTGRKRFIAELKSPNFNIRSFGERAAMNMPLQGSAADLIKIAMIKVNNRLKAENLRSKLILQVHDELIVDAPLTEAERVKEILKQEMDNVVELNVPLEVSISQGCNWFMTK